MRHPGIYYCIQCGAQMDQQHVDGRPRPVCPACGWIHYLHLKVGAGAVIQQEGRVLLLQRAHDPWTGAWNLPAGYCEVDEAPTQAAIREVLEETGLQVAPTTLLEAYFFDDDPRGNGVLLVYACRVVGGQLRPNAESQAARYFAPDELPQSLAGGGHDSAILDWQARRFVISDG